MTPDPALDGDAPPTKSAAKATPAQKAAADYSAKLRDALAETTSTMKVVHQALVPDEQAQDDDNPPNEAFFRACQNGDASAVATLLPSVDPNHRASPGVTALHLGASKGHLEVVRLLLDNGAELDPRLGLINSSYGYQLAGATPLILAVANRNTEVVQLLLARGADRNATTDRRYTGQAIIQLLQRLGQSAINLRIT